MNQKLGPTVGPRHFTLTKAEALKWSELKA